MLENNISIHQYIESIQPQVFLGRFADTSLIKNWRYENVTPSYNKFYYIVDGECYLKIDDKEYYPRKGQLFLLPYNSTQSYYLISKNAIVKYWIHCAFTCNDRDLFELIELPHYIEVDDPEKVTCLFQSILKTIGESTLLSKLHQKSCLLQLLEYYIEKADVQNKSIFKDERIALVLNYIETNINKPITVQSLSELMHLHPNYFISFFKKAMSISPMDYVTNVRIEKAKNIMKNSDISISEIAASVGFNNVYYFSRVFKSKTGLTPTEYRRSIDFKQYK